MKRDLNVEIDFGDILYMRSAIITFTHCEQNKYINNHITTYQIDIKLYNLNFYLND